MITYLLDNDNQTAVVIEKIHRIMGNNFSAEQLKMEFDKLDLDKLGYLELSELKTALKGRLSDAGIHLGVKLADKNEDGKISFEEFFNVINSVEETNEKSH